MILTASDATKQFCPHRAVLGQAQSCCVADRCMSWRWDYRTSDGFEDHVEQTIAWCEHFADDPDSMMQWLATQLAPEKASELSGAWADVDSDDYEALENLENEIDEALHEVMEPKLKEWVEAKWPPGATWLLKASGVEHGAFYAHYQRPVARHGYCGLAGVVR